LIGPLEETSMDEIKAQFETNLIWDIEAEGNTRLGI
jgi:hypothetical protein